MDASIRAWEGVGAVGQLIKLVDTLRRENFVFQ